MILPNEAQLNTEFLGVNSKNVAIGLFTKRLMAQWLLDQCKTHSRWLLKEHLYQSLCVQELLEKMRQRVQRLEKIRIKHYLPDLTGLLHS